MRKTNNKKCPICGYLLRSDRDIGPTCDGECKESYISLKALHFVSYAFKMHRISPFEISY